MTTPAAPVSSAHSLHDRIRPRLGPRLGITRLYPQSQKRQSSLSRPAHAPALRNRSPRDADPPLNSSSDWSADTSRSRSTSTAASRPKHPMTPLSSRLISLPFAAPLHSTVCCGEPDLNAILRLPGIFNGDNRSSERGSEEESRALEAAVLNVLPEARRVAQRHARAGGLRSRRRPHRRPRPPAASSSTKRADCAKTCASAYFERISQRISADAGRLI